MRARSIMLLALLLGVACSSVELLPDRVRVRTGPAAGTKTRKVVALPATCGALSTLAGSPSESTGNPLTSECAPPDVEGVDGSVRAALEFQGFQVIDSEQLNATSRERIEKIETSRSVSQGVRSPVEVQVRLLHVPSGKLVWARRCTLEVGGLITDAVAMERAARCATRGATAR